MTVKKPIKIVLAVLIAVILAVSALTLFVRSYLTDERIRTYVVNAAEASLGRKVSLGEIRVSIFTGVSIRDFELKEKDSDVSFIKAETFELRYQLLPLLSRTLIIDELRLSKANAQVKKNPDGSFNFSDIGKKSGTVTTGKETPGAKGLPVNLNVRQLSLKDIAVDYTDPSGKVLKARVVMDGEIKISSSSSGVISSSGKFSAMVAEAVLKDRPKALRDLTAAGAYAADIDLSARKVGLREIKADIAGVPFMVKGDISYADPLAFALDLSVPETKLAALQTTASSFLPDGASLDGAASLSIKAEKSSATGNRLSFKGEMKMNNASVAAKGYRPVFNGTVRFSPEQIQFDGIRLVAGETGADINGRIRNYSDTPDIQLDIKSRELNVDAISSTGKTGAPETTAASSPKEPEKEFGPLNTKALASIRVGIDKILVKGVAMQNVKALFEFRDALFRISSLTGSTLSGSFSLRSEVDLSKQGTTYTMNSDLNGILLEDITAVFAPRAKDMLYGTLYSKMDFSGAGTLTESIKRNLKGKGTFSVKGGKIRNAELSTGLLAFLGLQDLKEIPMDKADGSFTLSDGIVNLTSLIASKDLIMDEKGIIGMDQRLDLGVMVKASDRLSPKLLSQSAVSQFLSEEKGWTTIPLKISGTTSNPSYSVDTQYVGRKATEQLKKKAGEEIFKAITGSGEKEKSGKKSGTEAAPDQQQKKQGDSPGDLLKGLFGK